MSKNSEVAKMQISEQDASEQLSEILSKDPKLNDLFIEMVESIHMKQNNGRYIFNKY